MASKDSFYAVLSEGIAYFAEHGFDSQELLEEWLRRLETAARASLVPQSVLERAVRESLQRVFTRTTTNAALLRTHPGISQFTLQMIKPKLRLELDRRILVSTGLIKLNREASVRRTLQRFAGWATSIPIGGMKVANRKEVKAQVRRGIAGLPFEERRVVSDQGLKLAAAINEIVATDGGAIGGYWQHVKLGPPAYEARPEHVKRAQNGGEFFVIRDNWALRAGFVKLAGHQYTDQIEAPGEFIFCSCTYRYVYALRDIPSDMVTSEGREELKRVRAQITRFQHAGR